MKIIKIIIGTAFLIMLSACNESEKTSNYPTNVNIIWITDKFAAGGDQNEFKSILKKKFSPHQSEDKKITLYYQVEAFGKANGKLNSIINLPRDDIKKLAKNKLNIAKKILNKPPSLELQLEVFREYIDEKDYSEFFQKNVIESDFNALPIKSESNFIAVIDEANLLAMKNLSDKNFQILKILKNSNYNTSISSFIQEKIRKKEKISEFKFIFFDINTDGKEASGVRNGVEIVPAQCALGETRTLNGPCHKKDPTPPPSCIAGETRTSSGVCRKQELVSVRPQCAPGETRTSGGSCYKTQEPPSTLGASDSVNPDQNGASRKTDSASSALQQVSCSSLINELQSSLNKHDWTGERKPWDIANQISMQTCSKNERNQYKELCIKVQTIVSRFSCPD